MLQCCGHANYQCYLGTWDRRLPTLLSKHHYSQEANLVQGHDLFVGYICV